MQNLAPRLGSARIGRRGYALRGGERREGEGDERGEREESFQHGRDIGVEAEEATPCLILNGSATWRGRVCQYVQSTGVAVSLNKKYRRSPQRREHNTIR